MPTYEYACTDCGEHIEVVQSMSDAPLRVCGACGGQLRKVFSPIGIVFKGSGFYKTDSRSASARKSDSAASTSTGASGDGGSGAKSDGKASTSKSGSGAGKAAESA